MGTAPPEGRDQSPGPQEPPADFQRLLEQILEMAAARLPPVPRQPEPSFAQLWARLSPRMKECARLAALGETNREIAQRLGIKPNTVKSHMGWVYLVLGLHGVHNRRELAERMREEGPFRREGTD